MDRADQIQYSEKFVENKSTKESLFIKASLFLTLFFIFSIPWGNAVWDGFTRLVGIGAFAFVGLVLITDGTRSKFNIFHLLIAFFGAWLLISLMWSSDLVRGKEFLITTLQLLMIAFLLTLTIDSKKKRFLSYQSYVFGNLVGSGIIIYNFLNGIKSQYYGRFSIPNFDLDGLSIMLTLAIPMAAYLATQSGSKWLKLINVLTIPIIVFAVFLTGTRTASIVAIIGVAYWLFTYRNASFKIKSSFIILFVVSLITVFSLAPKKSIDRIFTSGQSITSGTLNNRTVIWGASIEQWKNAPLIGNGIGSLYNSLSSRHVEYGSAHNTYIHILTENGIIGLTLYLLIIISIIYYSFHTPLAEKSFLFALLMMILVSQITQHTHFHKETWFALTMLALHAYSESKRVYS